MLGATAGALATWLRPERQAATATLLAAARSPDPDGFRRKPLSLDELRSHLDRPLLAEAEGRAGLQAGTLDGAVELAARSESGLYDVTVLLADGARAPAAADALVDRLAARLDALREQKAEALLAGVVGPAQQLLARAEEAYLADVGRGDVEVAEVELSKGASAEAARRVAVARAARERLRLELERARQDAQAEADARALARAAAYASEPNAEPFAKAGAAAPVKRSLVKATATGGGAALFLALAAILLLGGGRRD